MYKLNAAVSAVSPSPVAEAQSWLSGLKFPAHKPLLDVAQAVPGYPPPPALREHLAEQALLPQTAFYTSIYGLEALREALAEHMSRAYQSPISAAQAAIVAGCNQGFCAALMALAGPGDEVILPLPYYFNHQMWVQMLGAETVPLPFRPERGGLPLPDDAAAAITPRTRAIALVSPNNPTGAVYPAELLEDFYRLASERGVALILDETYKDFRSNSEPAHALFQHPNWQHTLIQLYSFSKAFSLTGYRVGSVIAAPQLLHEIGKFQDCVAICAPHLGQQAALYGLRHLDDWRVANQQLMAERADALRRAFELPGLAYQVVASGAYFAYVKHPFSSAPRAAQSPPVSALTVAKRLLAEQHVLCLPGTTFGPGQDAYLRLAFANLEEQQMPQLAQRLLDSQADAQGPVATATSGGSASETGA